jgi:hypothetical protein
MERRDHAKILRITRKIHRWMGITLFIIFIIISITGFLLGWKKNSGDLLLPKTRKGTTENTVGWLPLSDLKSKGDLALDSLSIKNDRQIDRMDVRPSKGIIKLRYRENFVEVQLDGATGKVLSVGSRNADLIEHIHDGSVVDHWIGSSIFKVLFTSIAGLASTSFQRYRVLALVWTKSHAKIKVFIMNAS